MIQHAGFPCTAAGGVRVGDTAAQSNKLSTKTDRRPATDGGVDDDRQLRADGAGAPGSVGHRWPETFSCARCDREHLDQGSALLCCSERFEDGDLE